MIRLAAATCAAAAIAGGCSDPTRVLARLQAGPDAVCLTKVFLAADATPSEITAIHRRIAAAGRAEVDFVSSAQALARLRARFPDLVQDLPANPLPASLEVRATSNRDCSAVARVLVPPPPGAARVIGPRWVAR